MRVLLISVLMKVTMMIALGQTDAPARNYLISFEATMDNARIVLEWVTATEKQGREFSVEGSKDARDWHSVTTVTSMTQSSVPTNYFAFDENPFKGINYYRLKMTDPNGRFTYSQVRSIGPKVLEAGPGISSNKVNIKSALNDLDNMILVSFTHIKGLIFNISSANRYTKETNTSDNRNQIFSIPNFDAI
jgi:hypothetical protein